jgi:hypothetical protein
MSIEKKEKNKNLKCWKLAGRFNLYSFENNEYFVSEKMSSEEEDEGETSDEESYDHGVLIYYKCSSYYFDQKDSWNYIQTWNNCKHKNKPICCDCDFKSCRTEKEWKKHINSKKHIKKINKFLDIYSTSYV